MRHRSVLVVTALLVWAAGCGGGGSSQSATGSDGAATDQQATIDTAGVPRGDVGADATRRPGDDVGACPACAVGAASADDSGSCRCLDLADAPTGTGRPVSERLCLSVILPWDGSPTSQARRAKFFERAAWLGVGAVRAELRWNTSEPQPGVFAWDAHDAAVTGFAAHGLRVVGMLGYGNPHYSAIGKIKGDPYYPPDDPATFAAWAAKVAQRQGGVVREWEIWNEPNAGYRFWKSGGKGLSGDPVGYGALLAAAAEAIHAASPGSKVAFGGVFHPPQAILGGEAFAAQAFAAHPLAAQAIDAFAFHPYPVYPPQLPPEHHATPGGTGFAHQSLDAAAHAIQALLSARPGGARPLWITEVGWPTLGVSATDQARYLVRAWLLAMEEQVELLCWYTYMDSPGEHAVPWEGVFGLFDHDTTPLDATTPIAKPAAVAHRTMALLLGPLRPAGRQSGRSTARRHDAFVSADGGRVVHALWDETRGEESTPALLAPRPGRRYRVVDALAALPSEAGWPEAAARSDGLIELLVGATPTYVVDDAVQP